MTIRERLRDALAVAMKARDRSAITALRSALSAIDNAEAVDTPDTPAAVDDSPIAGSIRGLGAGEGVRRALSEDDVAALVRTEIDDRLTHAAQYREAGRREAATALEDEAAVLRRALGEPL